MNSMQCALNDPVHSSMTCALVLLSSIGDVTARVAAEHSPPASARRPTRLGVSGTSCEIFAEMHRRDVVSPRWSIAERNLAWRTPPDTEVGNAATSPPSPSLRPRAPSGRPSGAFATYPAAMRSYSAEGKRWRGGVPTGSAALGGLPGSKIGAPWRNHELIMMSNYESMMKSVREVQVRYVAAVHRLTSPGGSNARRLPMIPESRGAAGSGGGCCTGGSDADPE